jgi:hypothetical protein
MLPNGHVYEALGISKHFTVKPLICLLNVLTFILTTCCPMIYTHCWGYVLCLPLSPCVGKTYSFAIFGLCVSLCELQMCMALALGLSIFFIFQINLNQFRHFWQFNTFCKFYFCLTCYNIS